MAVKLIMTWDIRQGREQEYFEFVIREFLPGIQRLGLEPSDAWFTMYGDHPQIMIGAVSNDLEEANRALESDQWDELIQKLMEYVENYELKVVQARRGFQL